MKSNIAETSYGSPHSTAPEIVKGIAYDGIMADIWSCVVILYALFSVCCNHMNLFDGINNENNFLSSFTDNDCSSDDDPENNRNLIHYGNFKKRNSRTDDNNGDPHKESISSKEKKK